MENCLKCGISVENSSRAEHVLRHLSRDKDVHRYTCDYCEYGTYLPKSIQNHAIREHLMKCCFVDGIDQIQSDAAQMSSRCFGMDWDILKTGAGEIVKEKKRKSIAKRTSVSAPKKTKESSARCTRSPIEQKKFQCEHCDYKANSARILEQHSKLHRGKNGFRNGIEEENDEEVDTMAHSEVDTVSASPVNVACLMPNIKREMEEFHIPLSYIDQRIEHYGSEASCESETIESDAEFFERHRIQKSWGTLELVKNVRVVANRLGCSKEKIEAVVDTLSINKIDTRTLLDDEDDFRMFFHECKVVYGVKSAIIWILKKMKFAELKNSTIFAEQKYF